MKTTTIFLAVLFFLNSCGQITYSLNPQSHYTPISQTKNVRLDTLPIALYFEGEPINFTYTKMGLLELTGSQADHTVLDNFKYHAWRNGGNSVLLIKKERIQAGQSSYTDTCGNTTTEIKYTNKWTGVVASIADSTHAAQTQSSDTSYVRRVEMNAANTQPKVNFRLILFSAVVGGLVGWMDYMLNE